MCGRLKIYYKFSHSCRSCVHTVRTHTHTCLGYHSSSPYLIFFMGKSAYGVHHMAELRVWYGEDLFDTSESDNAGKSCTDVYGLMYKDWNISWEISHSHSKEVCHKTWINELLKETVSILCTMSSWVVNHCLLEVIYKLVCVLLHPSLNVCHSINKTHFFRTNTNQYFSPADI